jgi:aromatic ring-opening dioxygenase catalytic subunit (LigB family)
MPQICIGLGERNWTPARATWPSDITSIPGQPALGRHIAAASLGAGFDPAISHRLELDAGMVAVYRELDPRLRLPLVPIVHNCAVAPFMSVRRCYAFGRAVGAAIRSFNGLSRVALVGAGGLSHWIGTPRSGDIEEGFDRWFLERLEDNDLDDVLTLSDSEIELAGNGAHEIRLWLAVAGAVAVPAHTLAYDAGCPGLTGVAVSHFETP